MKHGGNQGGRPKGTKLKGTLEKEEARELLRRMVTAQMAPLVESQIANARGINFLVIREKKSGKFIKRITTADGEINLDEDREVIEVWAKDPSVQAFTDLMNRAVDKPTEMIQQDISMTIKGLDERLRNARKRLVKP